jgi:hypothetical protein
MPHLRQLVYASTASRPLRDPELLDLVNTARANNSDLNVTGMLLYASGAFIQILEGGPPTVEKLLRKIRRDPRHRGFLILLDRVIVERDFEGWHMGFQKIAQSELDQIAGFHGWSGDMTTRRKIASAIRLIESFRRVATAH